MYSTLATVGAIAAFAATATAHGITTGVTIDGVFTGGYLLEYYYAMQNNGPIPEHIGWYAENLDNGFVEPSSYGSGDIICHKAGDAQGSVDTLASVAAGGTVEFHWSTWPDSHMGPVITYVAPYTGDVGGVDKATLQWTKIQEDGFADGEWAAVKMIGQNNTWPVTVPASLKAGKYVFRHEIIALHGAGSVNGAQNYPQCLNIEVTGAGTEEPAGVLGTALYTETEDGIVFDPYAASITYNVPGPALWPASGSGSGSGSGSPAPAPPATPSATPTAAPSAPSASASASATPDATPVETPVAAPAPAPSGGAGSGDLPREFTIETFIAWLETKAASSARRARRHSRAFM